MPTQRQLAAAKGTEKSRGATKEKDRLTPVSNLPRNVLETARRILGQAGDIRIAAKAVGMSPERLQRQINHLR